MVLSGRLVVLATLALGCSSPSPSPHPEPGARQPPPAKAPSAPPAVPAEASPEVARSTDGGPAKAADAATVHAGADERRRFRATLADGRAASRAGDTARAAAAFERALALRPVDPIALCEAGWAHFQVGDLDRAAARLRQAVGALDGSASAEAATHAACLYNLGRVAEQRGQRAEALEHYRRSLALRPNDAVRTRLATLEASARAADAAVAAPARPAVGFESLEAAVRADFPGAERTEDRELGGEGRFRVASKRGPVGPVEELVHTALFSGGSQACSIGGLYVRTAAGWWILESQLGTWCEVDHGYDVGGFELLDLDLLESAGGKALVVVTFESSGQGTANLVPRPQSGRDYAHTVRELLVFEVSESDVDLAASLVTSARVSSSRWSQRCADEAEDEGMPAYAADCWQDGRTHVEWSTTVAWEGASATIARREGDPPARLLGTHDLAALRRLTGPSP